MVRQAEVLQSERLGGLRHVFQHVGAVAVGRVTVEDAGNVGQFDEFGKVVVGGDLEFAGMLAEFRRDIREAKYLVKSGLIAASDRAVGTGPFVLVELESTLPCARRRISMLSSLLPMK